jgi:hypothetical protein
VGRVRKLFVAILLVLCVGIHVLELSGRWDRTFQDATDEAGIVAVVLCIGVAVAIAGTLLKGMLARIASFFPSVPCSTLTRIPVARLALPLSIFSPPPLPLRI